MSGDANSSADLWYQAYKSESSQLALHFVNSGHQIEFSERLFSQLTFGLRYNGLSVLFF